mmetsp:Transcript_18199/g.36901  ORF Transcript_18199/g.36901 Transcript_18199/m.36901 type:complete len:389 (+) Transcript_18199:591-1757(+)
MHASFIHDFCLCLPDYLPLIPFASAEDHDTHHAHQERLRLASNQSRGFHSLLDLRCNLLRHDFLRHHFLNLCHDDLLRLSCHHSLNVVSLLGLCHDRGSEVVSHAKSHLHGLLLLGFLNDSIALLCGFIGSFCLLGLGLLLCLFLHQIGIQVDNHVSLTRSELELISDGSILSDSGELLCLLLLPLCNTFLCNLLCDLFSLSNGLFSLRGHNSRHFLLLSLNHGGLNGRLGRLLLSIHKHFLCLLSLSFLSHLIGNDVFTNLDRDHMVSDELKGSTGGDNQRLHVRLSQELGHHVGIHVMYNVAYRVQCGAAALLVGEIAVVVALIAAHSQGVLKGRIELLISLHPFNAVLARSLCVGASASNKSQGQQGGKLHFHRRSLVDGIQRAV